MHWSEINPVLIDLFTKLALDDGSVAPHKWGARWQEQREASEFVNPDIGFALTLKVTSCVGTGEDEIRREVDEEYVAPEDVDDDVEPGAIFETVCGQRRFTLQVQAEVFEHEDELWAMSVLERIRTRLARATSLDALLAVNVAYVGALASKKATITRDKRRLSVGVMDVTFVAAVNEKDPIPVGWIAQLGVTTEVKKADGTLVASPPNVANELVPPDP